MVLNIFKKIFVFFNSWIGSIILLLLILFFVGQVFFIPSRSMVGTLYEGDVLIAKKFTYGIPNPRLPWINKSFLPDFNNNGHLISGRYPNRGEVVVFIPPHMDNVYFVKRVFAKGGDEVIFTKNGLYLHPNEGNDYIQEHYPDLPTLNFGGKLFVLNPYSKDYPGIHYSKNNWGFDLMEVIYENPNLFVRGAQGESPDLARISMQAVNIGSSRGFYAEIQKDHFFMIGDNRDNSDDSRFWGSVPYSNIIGTPWFTIFSINLENSQEVDAQNNPKKRYTIRWSRMFKSLHSLEKIDPGYTTQNLHTQDIPQGLYSQKLHSGKD